MEYTHLPLQDALSVEADASYTASLIERGLYCLRQGHYVEGADLLVQARARAHPHEAQLMAALDAVNKATVSFQYAQQALQQASRRFAESEAEQQVQITMLQKLLPLTATAPRPRARPLNNAKGHRSLQLLQLLQPSDEPSAESQTATSSDESPLPALHITCFGRFEVRRTNSDGLTNQPIALCSNLKGQAILRYLVAQPKHQETVDKLMAVLWPEDAPDIAHHKLCVAISALRRSLNRDVVSAPGGGYILCKERGYRLSPNVDLRTDVDDFLALYRAGQQASGSEAANYYEQACHLYTGPFLAEDLYVDWSFIQREELSKTYVFMCDELAEHHMALGHYKEAAAWAIAMLKLNRCDEEAHRQLMHIYAAEGRRNEALQQYQRCQRVLAEELGVQPMPETQRLFSMLQV